MTKPRDREAILDPDLSKPLGGEASSLKRWAAERATKVRARERGAVLELGLCTAAEPTSSIRAREPRIRGLSTVR
jgi:hypothetical protein